VVLRVNPNALMAMSCGHATLSECRNYRYFLWREWHPSPAGYVLFVCLNPSTADETHDDPTVRRCIDFARRWGYGQLCVANLFAYRATHPRQLRAVGCPVGPDNDYWLENLSAKADMVVAAWGVHGTFAGRDREVVPLIGRRWFCLGVTKGGQPRHPLYLRRTVIPRIWQPEFQLANDGMGHDFDKPLSVKGF